MVDSTIKAFVFTAGPPAGVSFAKREGNPWRSARGGVCVCVFESERERGPQLKEPHRGSDQAILFVSLKKLGVTALFG